MSSSDAQPPFVAIACGGTGGHLFPGLAVAAATPATRLRRRAAHLAEGRGSAGCEIRARHGDFHAARRRAAKSQLLFVRPQLLAIVARGEENLSGPSAAGRSGDGRIHQRAAGSRRKRIRRENLPARIQHHSRPGQSFSRALCGRGIRRISRSRRAIESAQSHDHRHARASAIFRQ